ncbi:helix-turn-helix transcriptional regulator [Pasteurella bettyae]|uniref:helix-turn-helix transcriptional regulator n=1 Tax=Pasteurella bettyae TaxID=752 RepID=UPI003D2AD380
MLMPLAISQQGASIYLVCRFEGFDDNRLLALHRLQKAKISTFGFERPADFNLQQYQDEGNLGFSNQGKIRLSFSIEHGEGFHLIETPLSKDQKLLEESEEYYRFQATVADNDMLKWWLRRFGDNIWDIEKEQL